MEKLSMPIKNSKFELVKKLNDEFGLYRCRVMALGKNRNGSYFAKETVDKAVDSFRNIPMVGFMYEGEDGKKHFAGHEHTVVDNGGRLEYKSLCIPYGVVPADTEFAYEEVDEGESKATYLNCSVILWEKRYPEITEAMYSKDIPFAVSMEIGIDESKPYEEDNRYKEITAFNASAICLLGKSDDDEYNVEPCFKEAALLSFSYDDAQFSSDMKSFKDALAECFEHINEIEEGENVNMENEVVDTIETPVETNAKFTNEFANTYETKRKRCVNALDNMTYGEEELYRYYYLVDFDDTYVYVEQVTCTPTDYKKKCGRFTWINNEAEDKAEITGEFAEMFVEWLTAEQKAKIDGTQNDFDQYKETHSYENEMVEELKKFKADADYAAHCAEIDDVLNQFDDLESNDEFKKFKENVYSIEDVESIEEKCFAIRGRSVKPKKEKSHENKTPIVKDEISVEDSVEPYGGLFSLYGN